MRQFLKVFKALSDPNRVRIVKMLEDKPLCVCEIKDILGLANSTVSKHLSLLRDAELIIDEKDGKWVYYRLNTLEFEKYVNQILPLLKDWLNDEPKVLNDRNQAQTCTRDGCKI